MVTLSWIRTFEWDESGWRKNAACRDTPAELFFPTGTTGAAVGAIEAAKAVCRSCPVQGPCLSFALATNQNAGIWGATTEDERRTLPRGTAHSYVS